MGIESIIILFGSIGFVLMGLFALYMSTKENKTTKEQQQYIKINGLINIAIGAIGTIIGTISIFFKNSSRIAIIILIVAIFITTILSLNHSKYGYSNKPKNGIVWKTVISLPVDSNGQPDWEYMEKYIKNEL